MQIKKLLRDHLPSLASTFDLAEPVWQRRFDDFNLYSPGKIEEKLAYMNLNPVRAQLARHPCDWPWNSARFYDRGQTVGVAVGWVE